MSVAPTPLHLTAPERRVLGVLVEKASTVPDSYPMTIAGMVAGCNQKTARDPVTNYDDLDVEDALEACREKGLTIRVDTGGRVPKWKHNLYEVLKIDGVRPRAGEMAVIAELLLRGPQTEGDLRQRASRMCERDPINDLPALQAILSKLVKNQLAVYLTPSGQKRGAVVAHLFYPPAEFAKIKAEQGQFVADEPAPARAAPASIPAPAPAPAPAPVAPGPPAWQVPFEALQAELDRLRAEVVRLRAELDALKSSLGG